MSKTIITGGAGFIGSQLADALLAQGKEVIVVDKIPTKDAKNIHHLDDEKRFTYVSTDINDGELPDISKGVDEIYHLAANSDIRSGGTNPLIDYRDTLMTTHSVLEAVRLNNIPDLFFSSTSAVYGNKPGIALTENEGGLEPISYYGACKLSSEALISSYSYMCGFDALIFRFPNVVGPRLTHGVIFDFIAKLKKDPSKLEILGNGKQNKQYVYSEDLVQGIVGFMSKGYEGMNVFNVSTESYTDVNTIADIVCEGLGLEDVRYEYSGGDCGWKGDVSTFGYDISKAKAEGWTFRYNSTEAVRKTVESVLSDRE